MLVSEIHPSSQNCSSLQEQSQRDKKLVKHELPDVSCEDKSHIFSETVGMASCCSSQKMAGHISNVESRIPEDTTVLYHHQEVSLIQRENVCTASQHENYNLVSKSVSSMIETNTKLYLANESCQLQNLETPVKHNPISDKTLDYSVNYTSYCPQIMQTGV